MNNKVCVGYLTNIRDMFVVGSKQCEGEALKYQQNFISALNYAIELINDIERPQGEWILVDDTEKFIAKCSVCGRIEDSRLVKDYPFCHCGADMQKGGAE